MPKAFVGETERLQRNAIVSWRRLGPDVEIILFGTDAGTAAAAEQLGAAHWPGVETSEQGTPLLGSVFRDAQRSARFPVMMYVNADVILLPDLLLAVRQLSGLERFLACGRRIDLDVREDLLASPDALPRVTARARAEGRLHPPTGSDYFIFRRGLVDLPPFSVGRPGWDNWLIYWARTSGVRVVDATGGITAIHQNHDYSHSRFGCVSRVGGPEHAANVRLAGGFGAMLDLRCANWVLEGGRIRRTRLLARVLGSLISSRLARTVIGVKRTLQRALRP